MLKTHLQPILNFFFADSSERQEGRSSPTSMLKNRSLAQPSHLQPVIHYFNEQAQERATKSKLSQRSTPIDSGSENWLRRLWRTIITIDTDPQIKQQVDRRGQVYWHVFDPVTEHRATFLSKDEVYQWLEARYYQ